MSGVEFRIAESFIAALGLKFHRIERSRDPHFWSIRVGSDLRMIVHKTEASFLLAYVGHHDDAYAWAERRRIEAHPRTGAVQIVEVRERVEELVLRPPRPDAPVAAAQLAFGTLSGDELLGIGVPPDWLADVRAATEDAPWERWIVFLHPTQQGWWTAVSTVRRASPGQRVSPASSSSMIST